MPRYYFHIREGDQFEEDPEGSEFSSVEVAREEAIAAAREMVSEAVLRDEVIDGRTFEIATDDGAVVATVPLKSVIRL
ncbi:MAG TPA: hypothetical protein VGO22_15195 [Pseudorhizobium sp.]|nr:hypothetical protein [Pseudorhizobium sp.]